MSAHFLYVYLGKCSRNNTLSRSL